MKKLYLKHYLNDIYIGYSFIKKDIIETNISLIDNQLNISNEDIANLVLNDCNKEINKNNFNKLSSKKIELGKNIKLKIIHSIEKIKPLGT